MDITNLIGMGTGALQYKVTGNRKPLVVSISLTSKCNLRCTYCYSYEDNQSAITVPFDRLKWIIDEFYDLGTRVIMLQGGEPTLHKQFAEIVDYVKEKNIYCSVTTNGTRFEKHLCALKKLDQVQLSIDGEKNLTDSYRGKGVFDTIMKAIGLCNSNNIPFHLHAVITNSSTVENTLDPLIEICKKNNTYLNFCIPNPTGGAKDINLANNQQIQEFYQIILERKKQGMPTNTSYSAIKNIIRWGDRFAYDKYVERDDEKNTKKFKKCVMGNLVAWLDTRGQLHPCAVQFGQPGFSASIDKFGVKGAWDKIQTLPCHHCANSSEFNSLFNLKPEAIVNSLKFRGNAKQRGSVTGARREEGVLME